jgi:hypothetical protein
LTVGHERSQDEGVSRLKPLGGLLAVLGAVVLIYLFLPLGSALQFGGDVKGSFLVSLSCDILLISFSLLPANNAPGARVPWERGNQNAADLSILILLKNLNWSKMNNRKHHQNTPAGPNKSLIRHCRRKVFSSFFARFAESQKTGGFSAESILRTDPFNL